MSDKPHLVALGGYRFLMDKNEYDGLQRVMDFRWQKLDIIKNRPAYQFSGIGEETITLNGSVFNFQSNQDNTDSPVSATGRDQITQLRQQAQQGTPLRLALDDGRHLGYWVIQSINERQSHFIGTAPLKQAYSLKLAYFGERA